MICPLNNNAKLLNTSLIWRIFPGENNLKTRASLPDKEVSNLYI